MKNTLMNVKKGAKKVFRPVIATAAALVTPTAAFAAGDPTNTVNSGLQTLNNDLLIVAASAAGIALTWFGVQYHFAGEAHDKAMHAKHMKLTVIISAIIGLGPSIISFIFSLFHS